MLFYLVRHGEPHWQLSQEYGMTGFQANFVGLTPRGIQQVEQTALNPCFADAQLIVSSPYTRALQSAQILSRRLDLDVQVEFGLHEWLIDCSLEISNCPEELMRLHQEFFDCGGILPEGGMYNWETAQMVRERAIKALSRYTSGTPVIVTCHEVVIRTLTGLGPVEHAQVVPWEFACENVEQRVYN